MKNKIPKELKDYIADCAKKSAWNIGVSHYDIDILYMDKDKHDDDTDDIVMAEMTTNRRYLNGVMKIYPALIKMWDKKEKDEIKRCIHHEVAHLATQHVMDLMVSCYKDEGETKDAWETLTQIIGKMSVKIYEK